MDVVSEAVGPGNLVPSESKFAVIEAFGVEAVVAYQYDQAERARRAAAKTPPLLQPDALDLLMTLPLGEPVPMASLSRREHRALKSLPRGAVTRTNATVTRQAVQPIGIDLAFVPGRSWESAIEKAERFTPFCARAVVLDGPLRRRDEAIMRADFYGIGLLSVRGSGVEELVPPQPFVRKRHTVAAWRFLEVVHRQLP